MIRFLQQFESGQGDYAEQRREWVESTTIDDLKKKTLKRTKSSRKARR